ncbi:MAG: PD-(D/E)XK nuclease domain-containing protein [Methanobrevibacter sp.]|nr:PD-(D/E)XK nuclease domain-containing protein [Methanobrevibacter sp.]
MYGKIKDDVREPNFHMLFLTILRLMGFFVVGEAPFSYGTPDIILKKDNLVVVCELKFSQEKNLNDLAYKAMDQIKKKSIINHI